jgi:DNA polymerase III sliding clamp (beta) subunit (PCNA family)
MKLSRTDLKVANAAVGDTTRPVLTSLLIRDGKIAASDGFILALRKLSPEEGDGIGKDKDYQIPVEMIKKLKPKSNQKLNITVNEEMTTMNICEKAERGELEINTEPYLSAHMVQGSFPNYEQLFPKKKKALEITVSADILRKLLNCVPVKSFVRIGITSNPESPIEIMATDDHDQDNPIRCLLMPAMYKWDKGWYKE